MQEQYNVILDHLFTLNAKTRRASLLHAVRDRVPNFEICLKYLSDKGLIEEVSKHGNESFILSTHIREMMEQLPPQYKENPYGYYLKLQSDKHKTKPKYKDKHWVLEKIAENAISAIISGVVTFGLGFVIGLFVGKASNQSTPEKHQQEQPQAMPETSTDSTKVLK